MAAIRVERSGSGSVQGRPGRAAPERPVLAGRAAHRLVAALASREVEAAHRAVVAGLAAERIAAGIGQDRKTLVAALTATVHRK